MVLPSAVNEWPEFWMHLYQERVWCEMNEGTRKEEAEREAETTLRDIAAIENEQWYTNEKEAEKRYAAILELDTIRDVRKCGRFKASVLP
jgi:hypothetical protein